MFGIYCVNVITIAIAEKYTNKLINDEVVNSIFNLIMM